MADVTIGGITGGEDTSPANTAKIEIETGGVSKYAQLVNILKNGIPIGGTTPAEGTFTQIKWAKGVDVASASTLTLGSDGNYFDVTGTTAITSIDTVAVGFTALLHFDGALTFTHNATDLILPGGANITTAAGDEAIVVEYDTGKWRCVNYQRASGLPNANQPAFLVINSATDSNVTGDNTEVTIDFDTEKYDIGDNFASDTFTAPVTGKYFLSTAVHISGIEAGDGMKLSIKTSNREYTIQQMYTTVDTSMALSVIADMDAADTAYVAVTVAGGDKDVSIYADTSGAYTYFCGALIC